MPHPWEVQKVLDDARFDLDVYCQQCQLQLVRVWRVRSKNPKKREGTKRHDLM